MDKKDKKDSFQQPKNEKDMQKNNEYSQKSLSKLLDQEQLQQINTVRRITKDRQGIQSWDFYDQYLEFFSHILKIEGKSYEQVIKIHKDSIHKKLIKNNFLILQCDIQKKSSNFYDLKCKVNSFTRGFDVILLFCQLGPFIKKYFVLNEYEGSSRHHNDVIGFGTFGKIYDCYHHEHEKKSVIKCLRFEEQKLEDLRNHIKEFFICDMMSALEIGPKIHKSKGFDFIIFSDCLEFKMERCIPLVPDSIEENIKDSLFTLQLVRIVHCDIKPVNIMFSPEFGRNILIDFGTAQYIGVNFGQKVPTNFRGTYEFCGEEMRTIFRNNNKIAKVDLYKNDIQMVRKSIKSGRQIKKPIILKNRVQKGANHSMNENSKQYEVLCELKYHMYQNSKIDKLSKQTLRQFQLITEIFPVNLMQKIIYEAYLYTMRLQIKLIYLFQKEFLWVNPKMKYFNVDLQEDNEWNNETRKATTDEQYDKIKRLYFFLCNSQEKAGIEKKKSKKQTFENLQFLLQNHKGKAKFIHHEVVFLQFLKFIKFSKSKFQIDFADKQKLAKKMVPFIRSINGKKSIKYLKKKYQPSRFIIQNGCQNLVWVFSYLLSYCMNGEWSEFKSTQMGQILKNCLFLQFQYDIFLTECITFYFKNLAKSKNQMLLACIIMTGFSFVKMTNNHFLLAAERQCDYKKKYFEYQYKNVVNQLIQFIQKDNELSQYYRQKIPALQGLWWPYFKQASFEQTSQEQKKKIKNDIQCIINEIERQFLESEIIQTQDIFNNAAQAICFQLIDRKMIDMIDFPENSLIFTKSNKQNLRQKIFSLGIFDGMTAQLDKQILINAIQQFDIQTDAPIISAFFFMPERYQYFAKQQDTQMIFQLLYYVAKNKGCPSLNYKTIAKMFSFRNKSENFIRKTPLSVQSTYSRLMSFCSSINRKIIEIFIERDDFSIQFDMFFMISQNHRIQPSFKYEELQFMNNALSTIEKDEKQYFILKKQFISQLNFQDDHQSSTHTIQYLEEKNLFCLNYLQLLKRITKNQLPQEITQYFSKMFFRNGDQTNQIIKHWNNIKMKALLDKPIINIDFQFPILARNFMKLKNVKELTQLLGLYCLQTNFSQLSQDKLEFYYDFQRLEIEKKLKTVGLDSFYRGFEKIRLRESNRQKIIPFYIEILNKEEYMRNRKQWKLTFYQLHQTLFKASFGEQALKQKQILEYNINLVTLKYLKFINAKKKYIIRYIKETLKAIKRKTIFYRFQNYYLRKNIQKLIDDLYLTIIDCQRQKFTNQKITKINNKFKNYNNTLIISGQPQMILEFQKLTKKQDQWMQLFKQNQYEIEESFKEHFNIKDITLFNLTDCIFKEYQLWWIQQKNKKKYPHKYEIKNITQKVNQIKKQRKFEISEKIYQIIDQILDFQNQYLRQELKKKKGISLEDIQWIF